MALHGRFTQDPSLGWFVLNPGAVFWLGLVQDLRFLMAVWLRVFANPRRMVGVEKTVRSRKARLPLG
jgi:hypothetical protein